MTEISFAQVFPPSLCILVAGAGGFVGGHLVAELRRRGYSNLRAVDAKPLHAWHQHFDDVQSWSADLRGLSACRNACRDVDLVLNLAADMGGMGFIHHHKAECMLSVLISTHMLMAAREAGVRRYFFSSSACVYPADRQDRPHITALKEVDAYPAMPEDGYGWEKLFSERMCRHFREDYGLETRIARYHNVYGPHGTFDGGREKAPAAICRKVAQAKLSGRHEIEIWGDGEQTRSFMYVDDCVEGTLAIMASDCREPLNLGSAELVSINQLVSLVEDIARVKLTRHYNPEAPVGVRGRNSDNFMIRHLLGWEPSVRLRDGLERTYFWIWNELAQGRAAPDLTAYSSATARP